MPREGEANVINGYRKDSLIGTGQYGPVFLVTKGDQSYAMKVLDEMQDEQSTSPVNMSVIAKDEVACLQSICHPFIIRYFESFWDFAAPQTYIIMELCSGVKMSDAINTTRHENRIFPVATIEIWLVQMLMAVAYIHQKNIVHRDIKPNNVFIMNNYERIKLGDFGLVKVLDKENIIRLTSERQKRDGYRAPELWQGQSFRYRVDEWSLGCLLYELMSLQPPFTINKIDNVVNAIYEPISVGVYHNAGLVNVMQLLLTLNADERPHSAQILNWSIFNATKFRVQQMYKDELPNIQLTGVTKEVDDEFSALEMRTLDDSSSIPPRVLVRSMWSSIVDGYGGSLAFKPYTLPRECGGYRVLIWLVRRQPDWGSPPVLKQDMRLFCQTEGQLQNAPRLLRLKFHIKIQFYKSYLHTFDYVKCNEDALSAIAKGSIELLYIEHRFKWDELDSDRPPLGSVTVTAEWI